MKRVSSYGESSPCLTLSNKAATKARKRGRKGLRAPMILSYRKDQKGARTHLGIPRAWSGAPIWRYGMPGNRHLNHFVVVHTNEHGRPLMECQGERDIKGEQSPRKPPISISGVSEAIVLRGRESRPQGEGPQPVGVSARYNRMPTWRHLRGCR